MNGRAATGFAFEFHVATMGHDDVARSRQAQPGTTAHRAGREEGLEGAFTLFGASSPPPQAASAAVAVAARDNFRNWRLGIGLMVDLQVVPGCVMARQGLRKPDIKTNEYP